MTAVVAADTKVIAEHLRWLHAGGSFELRALFPERKGKPRSRVFAVTDMEAAVQWAADRNAEGMNVYCTLNPVKEGVTQHTEDEQIVSLRNLLIDCDPVKPKSDINATDTEKQAAVERAGQVRQFLAERGWSEPLQIDSGNGIHLTYAVDLTADLNDETVKRLLHGLSRQFNTNGVTVDVKPSNPARITKLAGTWSSKSSEPELGRPGRVTQILNAPPRVVVPTDCIHALITELPQPVQENRVSKPRAARQDMRTESESKPAADSATLERARAYLALVDPAIGGQAANPEAGNERHGHDQTMHGACSLVLGFNLSPDEALPLLREWNERCQPPWSEDELKHKLKSADGRGGDRGYLLNATPAAWDTPQVLARQVCERHTLRFVKDTACEYDGKKWAVIGDESLRAAVYRVCADAAQREYQRANRAHAQAKADLAARGRQLKESELPVEHKEAHEKQIAKQAAKLDKQPNAALPKVTCGLLNNTLAAVRGKCQLGDNTKFNVWVNGASGPPVLAVANGLLNVRARELRPLSPDWFSLIALPVSYDPAATCPRWEALINELMQGDPDRVAILQEHFGACLDPTLQVKYFAAWVGGGENGKGVVMNVLKWMLGEGNFSAEELSNLTGNRFASFALLGKLANLAGDQGYFESRDEGVLKTLTGGDSVRFEQKGRDSIVAENTAKLIFATNKMPTFSDKSEAIWNRASLLPFRFIATADKKDPRLKDPATWAGEMPGILNWSLEGLARLHANGRFTKSAVCDALKAEHRRRSNPARDFLESHYEAGEPEDFVPELYAAYVTWLEQNGKQRKLDSRAFAEEIRTLFPGVPEKSGTKKINGEVVRGWFGVRKIVEVTAVTAGNSSDPEAATSLFSP